MASSVSLVSALVERTRHRLAEAVSLLGPEHADRLARARRSSMMPA
jgi:hypothetical protein